MEEKNQKAKGKRQKAKVNLDCCADFQSMQRADKPMSEATPS
jgi:hypothetical protein